MKKAVLGLLCAVLPAVAFNWPIAPTTQAHPLGNNWGEFQDYGGGAYFHNGIDIFPLSVGAPVYAVAHGWVKGWGTIQANLHYRLAISDSAMGNANRCTGWLYAHIDPNRFHKNVGDEVQAGELIGYLVDFPYNFQHIHFARISDTGATWQRFPNYTWWFVQDPLTLLAPNSDTVRPVFEDARSGSRFAYCRDNASTYLSPDSLYGDVDIVARVHDRMTLSTGNSTWDRLAPFILDYRIKGDWDSLPWRLALSYKYGLPPPGTPEINVVYKKDATCNTRGDYNYREYYHVVTNTDGDSVIEASDSTGRWATAGFHDGYYWVYVRALDAAGNARVDSQRVRVVNGNPPLEVACLAVTSPPALCDTGDVIAPACSVVNNGPTAVSYSVRMRIGSGYNEVAAVTAHAPGERRLVSFPNWTAGARGPTVVRCSTELAGDLVPGNNRRVDTVNVLVHDAAVSAIAAPAGAVPPGPVQPRAIVRNRGTQREPVRVWFAIGAGYRDSVYLAAGLPPADTALTFAPWLAAAGNWTARCSAAQVVDNVRANDTLSAGFAVHAVDVAVEAIVSPADTVDSVGLVTPMARLRNNGAQPADFTAWFEIAGPGTAFRESVSVSGLGSGETLTVWVGVWPEPRRSGWHAARCSVALAFDGNPANDTLGKPFLVVGSHLPPRPGWVEMPNVPYFPSGRAVREGAWVAFDARTGLFVVAKGGRSADCYGFRPVLDVFESLPGWPAGIEGRLPYRGAAACADGAGRVYATKGNKTRGFWRCDVEGGRWEQLADVPAGPGNTTVKAGADLAYVAGPDSDYVYLLKGQRGEFWRYNVGSGEWQRLPDAPAGARPKWDRGSWLVYSDDRAPESAVRGTQSAERADGAASGVARGGSGVTRRAGGRLYAHKARLHELHVFDVASGEWQQPLAGMPLLCGQTGKSKKSKDGGSAAMLDGRIWALKGGNTQDFYSFDPATQAWAEQDTMPAFGSSLKRKRVKAGADIAADGWALYALKGNKTVEFWRYAPPGPLSMADRSGTERVAARREARGATFAVRVEPNPAAGRFFVSLASDPAPGRGTLLMSLHDVAGRRVRQALCVPGSTVAFDIGSLPAGVYYLHVPAAAGGAVRVALVR